jgi:hypothetical protein
MRFCGREELSKKKNVGGLARIFNISRGGKRSYSCYCYYCDTVKIEHCPQEEAPLASDAGGVSRSGGGPGASCICALRHSMTSMRSGDLLV